jgi:hypothetical protein
MESLSHRLAMTVQRENLEGAKAEAGRRRRSFMTVGTMMICVAAFSVSLHVGMAYRHSAELWRQSRFHAEMERRAILSIQPVENGLALMQGHTFEERQRVLTNFKRLAGYHARMKAAYRSAVFLPWAPIDLDAVPGL